MPQPLQSLVIAMVVCLLPTSWAWAQVSPDDPAFADQLLYHRAFEIALWALPATDSFAAREAIERWRSVVDPERKSALTVRSPLTRL